MAYSPDNWLFTVEGTIGPYEQWSNTWAAYSVDGGLPDAQEVADRLVEFYTALQAWLADEWSATSCVGRNLYTSTSYDLMWTTVNGTNTQDPLPSQLAIRASLNNAGNQRGGPFLGGWAKQVSSTNGLILEDVRTDIVDAVVQLAGDMHTDGQELGLHRPSHSDVVDLDRVRVGQRFDVIRRRANDTPESYVSGTF